MRVDLVSWKACKRVWDDFHGIPMQKLVLLALADYGDDEGASIYASLQSVADKVGLSRDHARRQIRALMQANIVSIVANAKGGRPGTTPRYRIHFDAMTDCEHATPTDCAEATPTGGKEDGDGLRIRRRRVAPRTERGCASATQTDVNRLLTGNNSNRESATSSPLPLDFSPSRDLIAWAKGEWQTRGLEVGDFDALHRDELAKFIVHFEGLLRKDWDKEYRTWMLRGFGFAAERRKRNGAANDGGKATPSRHILPSDTDYGQTGAIQ